jgi:hypothetical protein
MVVTETSSCSCKGFLTQYKVSVQTHAILQ